MRIFISLVLFLLTALSFANAQTTLSGINVSGQNYDITYRTGVSFDDYSTDIDDAPWWGANGGGESTAQAFADAADVDNLRFAFNTITFTTPDYALYSTNATTVGNFANADISANGDYAISAVAVPAPLPILGILPVVGFLKRMRKRQRA